MRHREDGPTQLAIGKPISSRRKHWSAKTIQSHYRCIAEVTQDHWGVRVRLRDGWVLPPTWATVIYVEHEEWNVLAKRLDKVVPEESL